MSDTAAAFLRVGPGVVYTLGWSPRADLTPLCCKERLTHLCNPGYAISPQQSLRLLELLRAAVPVWDHYVGCSQRSTAEMADDPNVIWLPHHVWLSEKVWQPRAAEKRWNAALVASTSPWKRHWLAAGCGKVGLITYHHGTCPEAEQRVLRELRTTLPEAEFVVEPAVSGFSCVSDVVAQLYNRSYCSLALSPAEGECRVVGESLLCGVPVVTTSHLGGRMEIVPPQHYLQVPPTVSAVAEAVQMFVEHSPPPDVVRRDFLSRLREERRAIEARFGPLWWDSLPGMMPWLPVVGWK